MNQILPHLKFIALVLGLFIQACTGNFDEINRNPYQPTDRDLQGDNYKLGAFLPQLQNNVCPTQENDYQMCQNLIGDVYGRYMSITNDAWKTSYSTFNAPTNWINYPFNSVFTKIYGAWSQIKKETNGKGEIFAWAQLLRIAAMHRMSDLYGPIPYNNVADGSIAVAYDDQQTVYSSFFTDLNNAIEVLTDYVSKNSGLSPLADYDYVYSGKLEQWIRFANSLKLRLALRIVYADPTLAKKMAEEAISHPIGIIASNSDNAAITCSTNPIKVMWDAYSDTRACADIIAYMTSYQDPRTDKYFLKGNINGQQGYFGLRSGINIKSKAWALQYSAPQINTTDKLMWLNAAEVAFLMAESALRGWNMGNSADHFYNKGIQLSFDQYGATGVDRYIANNTLKPSFYEDPYGEFSETIKNTTSIQWEENAPFEEKLERIITQKWIAMYPMGMEAWSDFRRTGYPRFLPVLVNNGIGVSSEKLARRIPFPPSELENNRDNYLEAIFLLGGNDTYSTRLWWDQKPLTK